MNCHLDKISAPAHRASPGLEKVESQDELMLKAYQVAETGVKTGAFKAPSWQPRAERAVVRSCRGGAALPSRHMGQDKIYPPHNRAKFYNCQTFTVYEEEQVQVLVDEASYGTF